MPYKDPEKARNHWREYRAKHPGQRKNYPDPRKGRLEHVKRFGLTPETYRELLAKQGGVCLICHRVDSRQLSVDHDHLTGAIRGLLCNRCNRGIGLLRDSADLCRSAAAYLDSIP